MKAHNKPHHVQHSSSTLHNQHTVSSLMDRNKMTGIHNKYLVQSNHLSIQVRQSDIGSCRYQLSPQSVQ